MYSIASLNESPSEKEGKSKTEESFNEALEGLNESPSEKEGKSKNIYEGSMWDGLNESPSEKEGKSYNA